MEIGTFESLEPVLGRELKLSTFLNRKLKDQRTVDMSIKSYIFYHELELHAAMARRRAESLVAARQSAWFPRALTLEVLGHPGRRIIS